MRGEHALPLDSSVPMETFLLKRAMKTNSSSVIPRSIFEPQHTEVLETDEIFEYLKQTFSIIGLTGTIGL